LKRVHLRTIAKRDLREAAAWYRERDPELANRFVDEVTVYGIDDSAVRQLPVDNFPYQVVFKRFPSRTTVLAIAHERKQPGYWNE
jgi:hypothetical protein